MRAMPPTRDETVLLGELAAHTARRQTNADLVKEVRRKLRSRTCRDKDALKGALTRYDERDCMDPVEACRVLTSETASDHDFLRAMSGMFRLMKKKATNGMFTATSSADMMRDAMTDGHSLIRTLKDILEVSINGNTRHGKGWSAAEEDSLTEAIRADGYLAKIDARTHESCVLHANKMITIKLNLTAAQAAAHFGMSAEDATRLTSPAHRRADKRARVVGTPQADPVAGVAAVDEGVDAAAASIPEV